jgi:HK97 family phage portal protein
MNFFSKLIYRNPQLKEEQRFLESQSLIYGSLSFLQNDSYTASKALKLSTVYRCVNLISDTIASMPVNVYQYKGDWKYKVENNLYNLLNVQPNGYQSAFTFKKLIFSSLPLKGNVYILKEYTGNEVTALHLLNPDYVTIKFENGEKKYQYISGKVIYDDFDIIHLMNYSTDGINGISTLQYASISLSISYDSENHAMNWFKSGANASGFLKPKEGSNINDAKAATIKAKLEAALNTDNYNAKSNSIIFLDGALDFQPTSINPRDSQMIENRQFNILDICRYFNVPPSLVFDQNSKYSTNEQQQIDFLTNTITPLLEKTENELLRKLYLPIDWANSEIRFDTDNMMRLDAATRASYYTQMLNAGAMSPNEIRQKNNADMPISGGNRWFVQQNLQPVDNLMNDIKNNDNNNGNNTIK